MLLFNHYMYNVMQIFDFQWWIKSETDSVWREKKGPADNRIRFAAMEFH